MNHEFTFPPSGEFVFKPDEWVIVWLRSGTAFSGTVVDFSSYYVRLIGRSGDGRGGVSGLDLIIHTKDIAAIGRAQHREKKP